MRPAPRRRSSCSSSSESERPPPRSGRSAATAGSSRASRGPAALWTALGILDVSVTIDRALCPAAGPRCGRRRRDPGRPRSEGGRRALCDRARSRPRVVVGRTRYRRVGRGCGASVARVRPAGRLRAPPGPRHLIRGGSEEKPNRFLPLRRPTLVLAIAAAASGAIQGMRYGSGASKSCPAFLDPAYVILTVLAFALVATALAAGRGSRRRHRARDRARCRCAGGSLPPRSTSSRGR